MKKKPPKNRKLQAKSGATLSRNALLARMSEQQAGRPTKPPKPEESLLAPELLERLVALQQGEARTELEKLLDRYVPEHTVKSRSRFPLGAEIDPNLSKVTTVALYPEHLKELDRVVALHRARGGRLSRSQAVRFAIEKCDWEELPDV
jgi:hypothetical protein